MMITAQDLYQELQNLFEDAPLGDRDMESVSESQVRVVFQPNYPLVGKLQGFALVRQEDGSVALTLAIGDGRDYATSLERDVYECQDAFNVLESYDDEEEGEDE